MNYFAISTSDDHQTKSPSVHFQPESYFVDWKETFKTLLRKIDIEIKLTLYLPVSFFSLNNFRHLSLRFVVLLYGVIVASAITCYFNSIELYHVKDCKSKWEIKNSMWDLRLLCRYISIWFFVVFRAVQPYKCSKVVVFNMLKLFTEFSPLGFHLVRFQVSNLVPKQNFRSK